MFKMLRDVEDGALVIVNRAQIWKDPKMTGAFRAMKLKKGKLHQKDTERSRLVCLGVTPKGWANGEVFNVESDCLVEVLDGNA